MIPVTGPVSRIERAGLLAALLLATGLMWPLRDYVTDDTFIHLQYARNLAEGRGLVFNLNERVYGCTSPLWVSLIADGIALGFDGLAVAKALGFLAALAAVGFFFQLTRRTMTSPVVRTAATLAWAGHAWMARWATSGMETPLAVALTLAGFVAFTEGRRWGARPVRTGALWSLAALTRPELALLLLLWLAFLLVETEDRYGLRRMIAGALPPLAIYGGWLVFSRVYFGTMWPQTLAAKTAGSTGAAFHLDNLWRQARVIGATDGVLAGLLLLGLVLGRQIRLRPQQVAQRWLPWAWVVALPALYAARGVPVLSRYLLVLTPVLAWLAWRSAERWWLGESPSPARLRVAAWLSVVVMTLVLIQNVLVWRNVVVPQVRTFTPALEGSLIRWGRWFGRHSAPDAVIATPDIGAIGYYSARRVVDLAGLVTPAMIPHLARESSEEAIRSFRFASFSRPDFLVDRAPEPFELTRTSRYASCLVPLGTARMDNLGVTRPEPVTYSFYRLDWAAFDSLRAASR